METNAQSTVVTIFQHVQIFFDMLDHFGSKKNSFTAFPVALYEKVVQTYLEERVDDKKDRVRIVRALSVINLEECGLLSFVNDARGEFGLQRSLLQTIQGLDSRRIRELGQPDLDIIYSQMKRHHEYFSSKGGAFSRYDKDFQEELQALMDTLQDILAKVDHNCRALSGSSQRLSEIIDSHDFNKLAMTDQVSDALDEIVRIGRRNINPTLMFLNEQAMAWDSSAMRLLREIKESFRRTTFHNEQIYIASVEMKLLSYSEVIKQIRNKLYRYVEMNRRQRNIYNAVEKRFNELNDLIIERMDTRLRGKKIPPEHSVFYPANMLRGLTNWTRTSLTNKLLQLADDDSLALHADEFIRKKLKRADAIEDKKRQAGKSVGKARDTLERKQRVKRIKHAMMNFDAGSSGDDIYFAIHQHLSQNLTGYTLRDIYDAMPFVRGKGPMLIKIDRNSIEYQGQKLTYMKKYLSLPEVFHAES